MYYFQFGPAAAGLASADDVALTIGSFLERSLVEGLTFYPVIFLSVGLSVLALRLSDPHAWLMAGLFASFLSVPVFPRATTTIPPALATFVLAFRAVALPAIPTLFYAFFALFPARSPIERAMPWLKWLNVAGWMLFALPNLGRGAPLVPRFFIDVIGPSMASILQFGYLFAGIPLGVVALTLNAIHAPADERKKARVLLWGTSLGALPILLETALQRLAGGTTPGWVTTATAMLLVLIPVSFAYAVVRHRVLDIPVLLKRSARYLLVRRGFIVLLAAIAASLTGLLAIVLSRTLAVSTTVATAAGVIFGIVMSVGSSALVRRATTRIDRAFFRSAYDASAILQNLVEQIHGAGTREAISALLDHQVTEALHPLSLTVFLEHTNGTLRAYTSRWPYTLPDLNPSRPWLQELARRVRPWDVSSESTEEVPRFLKESAAELLVPITDRAGRLTGTLVLGPRASEEPYSGDDKRLLMSVANQTGLQIENIRLAEAMAEHLDAERTAARELQVARGVQARLFPQRQPEMRTLDYAGGCVQALQVGGDYYDFLSAGPGRVGLVVADVAGKGIAAALLMANLQANLRSQYGIAPDDLERMLASVHRHFFENTADNQYATLFFADYTDDTRRLRFANCGHLPPYLFHADGTIEPLMPTGAVIGLFDAWSVQIGERELKPGDTLVIYTDGVTEATNPALEEFGSERLQTVVAANREHSPAILADDISRAVREFSEGHQSDDVTVVVARVR